MRQIIQQILTASLMMSGVVGAMAIDEAKYTVVEKNGSIEIRDYEPHLLVETIVNSTLEDAGNQAFRKLFRYISGNNQSSNTIAMTAPVSQEARGVKIPMTAPVIQATNTEGWAVSFMMPSNYTLKTLPVPLDPALKVREVPARRIAAIAYSGTWSEQRYLSHKKELETWILSKGLQATGETVWARYNPPFTPWFMRRNEILIPITK